MHKHLAALGFILALAVMVAVTAPADATSIGHIFIDGTTHPLGETVELIPVQDSDTNNYTVLETVGTVVSYDDPDEGDTDYSSYFFSFDDFDVTTTFDDPDTYYDVLGISVEDDEENQWSSAFVRVTDGDASTIDGVIYSDTETMFLMNPKGFNFGGSEDDEFFGEGYGGQLYNSGYTYLTTADYVELGPMSYGESQTESGIFYADPALSSDLSFANPTAVGFTDNLIAPMTFNDARPIWQEGYFSMIGGPMQFDQSELAFAGVLEIISVASAGEVTLGEFGQELFSTENGFEMYEGSTLTGFSHLGDIEFVGTQGTPYSLVVGEGESGNNILWNAGGTLLI